MCMKKEKTKSENAPDFSKLELFLGLSDQDEFQIKGHIKHLFHYEKKNNAIYDETGNHISGEMLLYIINHPDQVVNHGKGINSYQVLNEMMAKQVTYGLFLFFLSVFSFFQCVNFSSPHFSLTGLFFLIMFLISVLGIGINLGMMIVKIILNKEAYF